MTPAAKGDGGVWARGASDAPARASQDESADEPAGTDGASEVADAPSDAGVETLPFTGIQLALVLMSGLAARAGGLLLRRSARTAGR